MGPVRISVGRHPSIHIDSEQYHAIVRVRYRRYLARKKLPAEMMLNLKTLSEIRNVCNFVAQKSK